MIAYYKTRHHGMNLFGVTKEAEGEMQYWIENLEILNKKGADICQLRDETCDICMFPDGSGKAMEDI